MKVSRNGRKTTLKDDLADVIVDNLPSELESWSSSNDFNIMMDKIQDTIDEHIEEAIQAVKDISA